MRDSNPRSLMRNKSWACRLRPLGQSDFDMDYNNVAVMENVRLPERSSLMRNKSWACCLRPLGQSDLDMDYNNVAVMENVRLAERSKAVSLSLTLIENEGSNPSPDKKLHFVASLLPFNSFLKHSSAISQDEIIKGYSPASYNRRQEARTM